MAVPLKNIVHLNYKNNWVLTKGFLQLGFFKNIFLIILEFI